MNGFSGIFFAEDTRAMHQTGADCLLMGRHSLCAEDCAHDDGAAAMAYGRMRNAEYIHAQLRSADVPVPHNPSAAELLLGAYRLWGEKCIEKIEGAVICAVIDRQKGKLLLSCDRMGEAGSIFYSISGRTAAFASHPEMLLELPFVSRKLTDDGLRELFGLGPARTPSRTLLRDIRTLSAGCVLTADECSQQVRRYFRIECREHEDDDRTTVETVRRLTEQAVRDVLPFQPAAMLSGGLDSTALTALLKHCGSEKLRTFSLDYEDNAQHFQSGSYQPERDTPYIEQAVRFFGTEHTHIVLSVSSLAESLTDAMRARGFPGMADIDSSLLLFARHMAKEVAHVVSGECGDEVFGGYPWFNREELIEKDGFPWSGSLDLRSRILKDDLRQSLHLNEYAADCWRSALARHDTLKGESRRAQKLRKLQSICFEYFMSNLQERASMLCAETGLSVFTPLCDERLVQYVYNVPWEMKRMGGQEKGLLRSAVCDLLPGALLTRKKSPFPKTHHPLYAALIRQRMHDTLSDPNAPILTLIDKNEIERLMRGDLSPTNTPWFGQLMSGVQMLAYLLQINDWMKYYRIEL